MLVYFLKHKPITIIKRVSVEHRVVLVEGAGRLIDVPPVKEGPVVDIGTSGAKV